MSVSYQLIGRTAIVTIHRPERRNAVDASTATALADAFRRFDAGMQAHVAVLHGEGNTFCAGANLKAIGEGHGNRLDPSGDGPMGADAHAPVQARDRGARRRCIRSDGHRPGKPDRAGPARRS